MTLREQFEKEMTEGKNGIEKLFLINNSEYIKWLENKLTNKETT